VTGSVPPPSPFKTGLACRCPRCGRGRLFRGFLTVAPACPDCGLAFGDHDTGDGPAVFVILILGFVFVGLALHVEFAYAPPIWVHVILWPPLILGAAIGMLRPLKALLVALQYKYRADQEENGE